jgi:peptide/nickel transport system permease protein
MKIYLLKRFLYLVFVLFGVSFFTFIVISTVPGERLVGASVDAPMFARYLAWLRAILVGRTGGGTAWQRQAMLAYMGRMIPSTLRFTGISLAAIAMVSLPLGVMTAVKKDSLLDNAVRAVSFVGACVPDYLLGFLLMFLFGVIFHLLPVFGDNTALHFILPICALAFPLIARFVRQIRGATLEELSQDYVVGAAARGVRGWRIVLCHALPNAMPSILTYLGVSIGHLLNSVAVIETLFVIRGVGATAVNSIRSRDYSVIQAYVLWMAIIYLSAGFVLDVVIHATDPQIRRKEAA